MADASPLSSNAQGRRPRHTPLRTCVACRTTQAKGGLVRVVKGPDGVVRLDATGRLAGRGAYLHLDPVCLQEGMRKGRLGHALRTTVSAQDQALLSEQLLKALEEEQERQDEQSARQTKGT